jgi:hypothetical protein
MVGYQRGLHAFVACLLALHIVQAALTPDQKQATKVVARALEDIASGNLQARTEAGVSWNEDCLLAKDKEALSTLKQQYEDAGNTFDWKKWVSTKLQAFRKTRTGREHVAKFDKEAGDKLKAAAAIAGEKMKLQMRESRKLPASQSTKGKQAQYQTQYLSKLKQDPGRGTVAKLKQAQYYSTYTNRDMTKDAAWRKSPGGTSAPFCVFGLTARPWCTPQARSRSNNRSAEQPRSPR